MGHEGPVTAKACRGLVYLDLYVPPEGYTGRTGLFDLPHSLKHIIVTLPLK